MMYAILLALLSAVFILCFVCANAINFRTAEISEAAPHYVVLLDGIDGVVRILSVVCPTMHSTYVTRQTI
jgi:hypothetical protein